MTYKNLVNSAMILKMILAVSKNQENLNKLSQEAKVYNTIIIHDNCIFQ